MVLLKLLNNITLIVSRKILFWLASKPSLYQIWLIDWLIDWCLIPTLADLVLKLIKIGVSLFTVLFYTCLMECCGILHSYCYILWKMLDFFWHFGCLLLWTVFHVVKCTSLHCASCMIVVKFFILNLFECY